MTPAQSKAADLATKPRELLVEHVKGFVPLVRGPLEITRGALLRRGLVRYKYSGSTSRFPVATVLTEEGREVVCVILGQYADSLIAAADFLERVASPPIVVGLERELALAKLMANG